MNTKNVEQERPESMTQDEIAKCIADSFFEATLENAFRHMESLRATRDTAAIQASNERLKEFPVRTRIEE